MSFSPSNSGVLAKPGDLVTLDRNPVDDCVGVQAHGDGEGVELIFEGTLGQGLVPLKATPGADTLPAQPDGRFCYLIEAEGVTHVQVRLGAISSGSICVGLFSGKADVMKQASRTTAGAEPKPAKLPRAATPPTTGYRPYEDGGKYYAINNETGQSSEAFATAAQRDAYIAQQTAKGAVKDAAAPKAEHHAQHRETQPAKK